MAYKSDRQSEIKASLPEFLTRPREPYQFMLYLGLGGSGLLFLMFSVLYTLRKGTPGWVSFELPTIFWISTLLIIASSATLHFANQAFRHDKFKAYRWQLAMTLDFGILFAITQFMGWRTMMNEGIVMSKSTSGAFLYIISGLHLLHVAGGLFFLGLLLFQAIKRTTYVDSFIYSVNPPNQLRLRLVTKYWHYVDALWVFLFLFFLLHQYL
jgi:cytochrome c oxidase subunit III